MFSVRNAHNYSFSDMLRDDLDKTFLIIVNDGELPEGLHTSEKGFKVTNLKYVWEYFKEGSQVVEVTFPGDAKVEHVPYEYMYLKTDKIISGKHWGFNDWLEHVKPVHIPECGFFRNLDSTRGLEELETVGINFHINGLPNLNGLSKLHSVGRVMQLYFIDDFTGLKSLNFVGENILINDSSGYELTTLERLKEEGRL